MASYRALTAVPRLVERALALAEHLGFLQSCSPEIGRLLAVLAGHVRDGVVGEIGTGCGVVSAWMVSALSPEVRLVTIELDAVRAEATQSLFAAVPNVRVPRDDWHDLLPLGPFSLLFVDGGRAKQCEPGLVVDALRPGGLVVLDDLTPEDQWPVVWHGKSDAVRDFWLNDPRLAATEVLTSSITAAIVATRVR